MAEQATPWSLLVWGSGGALGVAALTSGLSGMCRSPWEAVSLATRMSAAVVWAFVRFLARGCRPEFPKWTLRFELLRAAIRTINELYGDRMVKDAQHARVVRAQSAAAGTVLGWLYCRWYGRRMEAVDLNGLEHLWLRPKSPAKVDSKRLVVLYVHGGAFSLLSPRFYSFYGATLAAAIERELGVRGSSASVDVFLANYRKTPEFCFPKQPEDIVAAYEYLLGHEGLSADQVILAGDSAGGGLVMSALLRLRDSKKASRLPRAAIVSSPFVDFSQSIDPSAARNCILTRSIAKAARLVYLPTCSDKRTWADASAVHCDLRGLPPVFIQAATLDYLYQDSVLLAEKAKADGVGDWEMDEKRLIPFVFRMYCTFHPSAGRIASSSDELQVREATHACFRCLLSGTAVITRNTRQSRIIRVLCKLGMTNLIFTFLRADLRSRNGDTGGVSVLQG